MEDVLVIRKELLKPYITKGFSGLIHNNLQEIQKIVLKNFTFKLRSEAEYDFDYKQIIPYVLVKYQDQFLLLKRTKKQTEKRLHEKLSLGIGGHINPCNHIEHENIIIHGLYKELHEEVSISLKHQLEFVGVINDETTEVSQVHLGFLYLIQVQDGEFEILEKEKMMGEWATVEELAKNYEALETWSQIVYRDLICQGQEA